MVKKILFASVMLFFAGLSNAAIYKWVDEDGNIHYGESPPPEREAQEIKPEAGPSMVEIERAQERLKRLQAASRSLTLKALGPLPENVSSRYLATKSTGITTVNWKKRIAQYTIMLSAKPDLPFGAYLEAHFDNPADPGTPLVVRKLRQGGQQEIFIMSPEFKGLKCWNYGAVIYVYRGSNKSQLLGVHQQTIQSRINLENVKSLKDVLEAGKHGNCP